ncbi:MAG: Rrf2 family transcriptional regulator [Actinomycetota bacterium]
MLKISQKTEYALRAMIQLAGQTEGALLSAREISESQRIPLRFLEQQLGSLSKAGLVESFRGAGGGCRLARGAAEVTVADVVDAIEGPFYPMFCLDPTDHTCWQESRCGLQDLWGDVRVAVRAVFERITLAELAQRQRRLTQPVISPDELLARG